MVTELLPAGFPVNSVEKAWIELRMRWMADQFGINRLLETEVILPSAEHFPDSYHGTPEDAEQILGQLCDLMGLSRGNIRLQIADNAHVREGMDPVEEDHVTYIQVRPEQISDAQSLLVALCYELSQELLLGTGLLTRDAPDHVLVIDLLPVYLGLGIFPANRASHGIHPGSGAFGWWNHEHQGYLTSRELGYALAVFAFVRQEDKPAWAEHLRLDAQVAVRDGLKYLLKTGDALLHPETCHKPVPSSEEELIDQIGTGFPSAQIIAFWQIKSQDHPGSRLVDAVSECLYSEDPHVPGMAAKTLGQLGDVARSKIPELIKALEHKSVRARTGAVEALGALQPEPAQVMPTFARLLQEDNRTLIVTLVLALRGFPPEDVAPAIPPLMKQLQAALVYCDYVLIDEMTETLKSIVSEPRETLEEHLSHDPELLHLALQSLMGELHVEPGEEEEEWDDE